MPASQNYTRKGPQVGILHMTKFLPDQIVDIKINLSDHNIIKVGINWGGEGEEH